MFEGIAIVKRAIFEQIYINNTSSKRAEKKVLQINNWKLMIKARRTWVKKETVNIYNLRQTPTEAAVDGGILVNGRESEPAK